MSTSEDQAPPDEGGKADELGTGKENKGKVKGGPGYPPFLVIKKKRPPPSIPETIKSGKVLRSTLKNAIPKRAARRIPQPAAPKGPMATDVRMNKSEYLRHEKCIRRHRGGLPERIEVLAKPTRRQVLYMWRTYANSLTPEQIHNLSTVLDAADPYGPSDAYAYFSNLRRSRKKRLDAKNDAKKKIAAMKCLCAPLTRQSWVRTAMVEVARGLQQRLGRPGQFELDGAMLRLSDLILRQICAELKIRRPSRRSSYSKDKFMVEMADKIAVWIDEIVGDSEERLLQMDADEDNIVERADDPVIDTGYADAFLNMMGGKGQRLMAPKPAYLKFTGDMLKAFTLLTDAMYKRGSDNLLTHGKFKQSYKEGADDLRATADLNGGDYNTGLYSDIKDKLTNLTAPIAVDALKEPMKEIVEICSKYLASNAENNKDKGAAFKYLVRKMHSEPDEILISKGKIKKTMEEGAVDLEQAKDLSTDHADPGLADEISRTLATLVRDTPDEMKDDMAETLEVASKYLAQKALDDSERGPAFDKMLEILNSKPDNIFEPTNPALRKDFNAAHALKNAPGLTSSTPDPTTINMYAADLHEEVDAETPRDMKGEMDDTIKRGAGFLSAYSRDRALAKDILVKAMKDNGAKEAATRKGVTKTYAEGAVEVETAPTLIPLLPVKDIVDELKSKLAKDVAKSTPKELKGAMTALVKDAAGEMSQSLALKSGVAGERYGRDLLAAVADTMGHEPLFKEGSYGMTFKDAADSIRTAGQFESDPSTASQAQAIENQLAAAVNSRVAPATAALLAPTVKAAAAHLAKTTKEKGEALSYLLQAMRAKGDKPLARIQGITVTYAGGAERVAVAKSLVNDHVDKGAYESVRSKLKELYKEKPNPQFDQIMPGVIDEVSKFLGCSTPETSEERKALIGNILTEKGSMFFTSSGDYKITYKQTGKQAEVTPTGAAEDAATNKLPVSKEKQEVVHQKLTDALAGKLDKNMESAIKEDVDDVSAYVGSVVEGRGKAMEKIKTEMNKKGGETLAQYNGAKETHSDGAKAIETAQKFKSLSEAPLAAPAGLTATVETAIDKLPLATASPQEEKYMREAKQLVAQTIATDLGAKGGYAAPESGAGGAGSGPGGAGSGPGGAGGGPGGAGSGPGGAGGGPGGAAGGTWGGPGGGPGGAGGGPGGAWSGPGGAGGVPGGAGGGPGGAGGGTWSGPGGAGGGPGGAGGGPGGAGGGPGGAWSGPGGAGGGPGGAGGGPGGAGGGPGGAGGGPGGAGGGPGGAWSGPGGAGGGPGGAGGGPGGAGGVPGGAGGGPGGAGGGPGGAWSGPGGAGGGPGGAGGGPGGAGGGTWSGPGGAGGGPGGAGGGPGGAGGGPGGAWSGPGGAGGGPGGAGGGPGGAGGGPGGAWSGPGGAGGGPGGAGGGPGGAGGGPGGAGPGPGGAWSGPGGAGGGPGGAGGGPGGAGGGPGGAGGGPGGAWSGPGGVGGGPGGAGGGPGGAGSGPGGAGGGAGGAWSGPGGAGGGPGGAGSGPGGAGGGPGGAWSGPGGAGGGPGGAGSGPGGAGGGPGGAWSGPGGAGGGPGGAGSGPGGAGGGPGGAWSGPGGAGSGPGGARGPGGAGGGGPGEGGTGTMRLLEDARRRGNIVLDDPDHQNAKQLLLAALNAKGNEEFHRLGPISLTHSGAANALKNAVPAGKSVREAADTDRLARKFEKKLGALVENTPAPLRDAMTDVVIESARTLGEYFVTANFSAAVKEGLIDAMQKKDNEILVEESAGQTETFFYAAQRLKLKEDDFVVPTEPDRRLSREIANKLEESVKTHAIIPRKLSGTVKEHVQERADYLSINVTKPDDFITALVDLFNEMEAEGHAPLVEGKVPMTNKQGAAYLKSLTSFKPKMPGKTNPTIQGAIEAKMKQLMDNVENPSYNEAIKTQVIKQQAGLLTNYLVNQGEKTDLLKELVKALDEKPDSLILRHGNVRKTNFDVAEILRDKNAADLLDAKNPDPVVSRKLQIKLQNQFDKSYLDKTPLMLDVIDDASNYLAVQLIRPRIIKVCKCRKSVFVQCELWNEEILRRVARPCCMCNRHVSSQSLDPESHLVDITIKECRSMAGQTREGPRPPCQADIMKGQICMTIAPAFTPTTAPMSTTSSPKPRPKITWSTNYVFADSRPSQSVQHESQLGDRASHTILPQQTDSYSSGRTLQPTPESDERAMPLQEETTLDLSTVHPSNLLNSFNRDAPTLDTDNMETSSSYGTPLSKSEGRSLSPEPLFENKPVTMFVMVDHRAQSRSSGSELFSTACNSFETEHEPSSDVYDASTPETPMTTDQMSDYYAMMVSLMWNMQAWRNWLQENLDQALTWNKTPQTLPPDTAYSNWLSYKMKVLTEAVQWRLYNNFSRQLALRLDLRYRDKQIVSPTRATVKTRVYKECQREMLEIIDMFNIWTRWLISVLKSTELIEPVPNVPLHELCWIHFKEKTEESLQAWIAYNTHLNVCWTFKYRAITEAWKQQGPVWVVSACGAVPSNAVSAGYCHQEVIWVARTTHKEEVLPAALIPSKHCCIVYADKGVHCYSNYQVMCNAEVQWVGWRAGEHGRKEGQSAVAVAPGVHVGRVQYQQQHLLGPVQAPDYRCHVVIHDRAYAFACYDLLVLAPARSHHAPHVPYIPDSEISSPSPSNYSPKSYSPKSYKSYSPGSYSPKSLKSYSPDSHSLLSYSRRSSPSPGPSTCHYD